MIYLVEIGKRIKELREESGFSEELLSDFLDISVKDLRQIEKGEKKITSDVIKELSDLFLCSENYLLFRKDKFKLSTNYSGVDLTVEDLKSIVTVNRIAKNQFEMDELLADF